MGVYRTMGVHCKPKKIKKSDLDHNGTFHFIPYWWGSLCRQGDCHVDNVHQVGVVPHVDETCHI